MPIAGKPKLTKDLRQTAVRLDPEITERLNAFCKLHPLKPRRDSVIDHAILQYLEREEPALVERKSA